MASKGPKEGTHIKEAAKARAKKHGNKVSRLLLAAVGALVASGISWWRESEISPTPGIALVWNSAETHDSALWGFNRRGNEQFLNWTVADAERILNNSLSVEFNMMEPCGSIYEVKYEIPTWYDPRLMFPGCFTSVYRQGNCSSAYASAAASVLSDRFCIQSKMKTKVHLDPSLLVLCDSQSNGCTSGHPDKAWDFLVKKGLFNVTETDIKDSCDAEETKKRRRFKAEEPCATLTEEGIMREVKKNGPVVVLAAVYSDFLTYSSGIYLPSNTSIKLQGRQPLELFGWGTDVYTGKSYWLVKNSWGKDWGEEGIARISRTALELEMMELAVTGSPLFVPEEPEPLILQDVKPEELDLDSLLLP